MINCAQMNTKGFSCWFVAFFVGEMDRQKIRKEQIAYWTVLLMERDVVLSVWFSRMASEHWRWQFISFRMRTFRKYSAV